MFTIGNNKSKFNIVEDYFSCRLIIFEHLSVMARTNKMRHHRHLTIGLFIGYHLTTSRPPHNEINKSNNKGSV